MPAFRVEPQALAAAGEAVSGAADRTAGAATAVRSALSALGAAAGHRGAESAAEDAAFRWRCAVQAWARSADHLGTSLRGAAASYTRVDAAQVPEGP